MSCWALCIIMYIVSIEIGNSNKLFYIYSAVACESAVQFVRPRAHRLWLGNLLILCDCITVTLSNYCNFIENTYLV